VLFTAIAGHQSTASSATRQLQRPEQFKASCSLLLLGTQAPHTPRAKRSQAQLIGYCVKKMITGTEGN
jgi:hypothetical protein